MLIPFTIQGNPSDKTPLKCACDKAREARDVAFVWTNDGDQEPAYHPVCPGCILKKVIAGNC